MNFVPMYDIGQGNAILKSMYETSDWSDLTIVCEGAGKQFKVHKSVVCLSSSFFHAACTRDFMEKRTGIITLPEKEHVIDAVIRHCYNCAPLKAAEFTFISKIEPNVQSCVDLLIAADKYQLPILADQARSEISGRFAMIEAISLVEIGVSLHQSEHAAIFGSNIFKQLKIATAAYLLDISQSTQALSKLSSCQQYLANVVGHVAEGSDKVAKASKVGKASMPTKPGDISKVATSKKKRKLVSS